MADPKKTLDRSVPRPGPQRAADTPAPPEAGNRLPLEPPSLSTRRKDREAPKAPVSTTPKPADGKKEPRLQGLRGHLCQSLPMGKGAGGPKTPCGHYSPSLLIGKKEPRPQRLLQTPHQACRWEEGAGGPQGSRRPPHQACRWEEGAGGPQGPRRHLRQACRREEGTGSPQGPCGPLCQACRREEVPCV